MADKLETYRRKRRADATPEPMGGGDDAAGERGRFVIQEHHATRLHWDLRLERDGVLVSFAIPNGLPPDPGVNRKAVQTEDHPLEYLDFHGQIPKGEYGAGSMTIWDTGTYETLKWEPKKIEIALHGEQAKGEGRYALFHTGPAAKDWMIHRMDPPADPDREPIPERIVPMLATLSKTVPPGKDWAFEIKWDGVRAIAYSEPGRLRFESRNLRDITASYPELSKLNRALSHHSAVLDGEIVAFDDAGRPSFHRLQHRMHVASESAARRLAKTTPVVYLIFDLLWLDGHSLMARPYAERREALTALELTGPSWQTPEHIVGNGKGLLAASQEQGLEGVVAKRLDGTYEPGRRSRNWLKVKNKQRGEFAIVGWLPGEGRRRERIGALLVANEGDRGLAYAGRVGTGFNDAELEKLQKLLGRIESDGPPVTNPSKAPKTAIWTEPRYVAEVEFGEWTNDRILRHPAYKGLVEKEEVWAPKKLPDGGYEVTVEGRRLKLTNLDKVLYPKVGFTKGDVIDYYRHIADVLLPHLRGRALTLKRYPNGVEESHFFEKQCPKHRPDWVRTLHWKLRSKAIDFCSADDLATLVWLGNLADLELHTSLSRGEDIETPAILAFDLDPGPPATIVECCQVALWLQGMFERLGIQSFAKTSGSKGMQIYVPLNTPDVTYEGPHGTKAFARAVAELLEREEPDLVVSRMTRSLRPGKVLVDWSQNDEHKTTVNVYSLRAKERPTVSTPITWDEVRGCHKAGDPDLLVFDSAQVLTRVEEHGDLFAPVASLKQELPRL